MRTPGMALRAALFAALLTLAACDGPSDKLKGDIDKAAERQSMQEEASSVSQEIDLAPAANLTSGTGDISTAGNCAEDITIFCPSVKPGYAHIAECLSNQIFDERDGNSEYTVKVSAPCRATVLEFKMRLAENINLDVNMAAACKNDAKKFCDYTKDYKFPGKVIACLREKKGSLSGKCRKKITVAQIEAAEDYRLNANLYDACKGDAENICKDVEAGSGRVNACLRDNRDKVSWDCQEEIFRADMENADDVRLSVRLFRTCLPEKRQFCADIAPGNAGAKDCLEEHRDKAGFGEECKALLDGVIELRARDFRLDTHLREACAADIEDKCGFEKDASQAVANKDGKVVTCLQDYRHELQSEECGKAVKETMARASDDIRFATGLADACVEDRATLCKNIPPGSARVIRCLQDSRAKLAPACKTALFDHEVRMAESIEFDKPMAQACTDEIGRFCANVPPGDARVIWCLQQHKQQSDFGEGCKDEVKRFEKNMSRDYRLNRRLYMDCEHDISALCPDTCDIYAGHACGGAVLRCLTDNKAKIKKSACKQEVFYFIKMEVNDFGNDIILAEACREDHDKFCAKVKSGGGRVHDCLRSNRDKLSQACRSEELKLEIEEASNFQLKTSVTQACADERSAFCAEVDTGNARVFRCLVQNLGRSDFGATCRSTILRKLARRQENWKLDVNLRTACKEDAGSVCGDVDHESDKAETARCLFRKHDELSDACLREASRAAHMALWVWQPGTALSAPCDADFEKLCPGSAVPMGNRPGKGLRCLARTIKRQSKTGDASKAVSSECKALVDVAEPPDEMEEYTSNLQMVSAQSMKASMSQVGMWSEHKGITITGYSALFCFSALCTTLIMALRYGYKRWRGVDDAGYTRVLKSGDV